MMDCKQVHVTRTLPLEPVAHAEQLCAPAGIADSVLGFAARMFGVPPTGYFEHAGDCTELFSSSGIQNRTIIALPVKLGTMYINTTISVSYSNRLSAILFTMPVAIAKPLTTSVLGPLTA